MRIEHNATLMRIYISEARRHEGHPAFRVVVEAAAASGLAGAVVFKGIEGFGPSGTLSAERTPDAFADLPMLIEIVDADEKIRAFVPILERLVDGALVTLERIASLAYRTAEDVAL